MEGVGNAGCPLHPQPRLRFALVEMHTSNNEYTGNARHSRTQWFYGLLRALLGDRALLPPSSADQRMPAPGRAGMPPRTWRQRPGVRTTRLRRPWIRSIPVSTKWGSEIFLQMGLDTPVDKLPDGQITGLRREHISLSCPGRGAAHFALLRSAGTHIDARTMDPISSAPLRAAQHPGNGLRRRCEERSDEAIPRRRAS